jgi:chromosome segregation ATPase
MIENFSTFLPILAVTSAVSGFLGWSMHTPSKTTAPAKSAPTADKGQQERVKNLEASLEKSKATHKVLKSELENLQSSSVTHAAHEATVAELAAIRKASDTEAKRISALEADLKKSQETIKHLNARTNEADKAQKDRRFALENELSKAREGLALIQNRPDDSAGLQVEIERLRESVAVSTRYAGEMRKREAAAVEALEKAENRLAELGAGAQPVISKKIGPVVDSGRIAAAKAEVIRLVELNKQKESAIPIKDSQAVVQVAEVAPNEVQIAQNEAEVIPNAVEVVLDETEAASSEVEVVSNGLKVPAEEGTAPAKQAELPLVAGLS